MKSSNLTSPSSGTSKESSLKIAKQQLNSFQKQHRALVKQIKAERKGGPPIEEELKEQLGAIKSRWDQSKARVSKAKAHSKKRKREIDDWKNWFSSLMEDEKVLQMQKLQAEIAWRAGEIAATEAKIAALYTERLEIEKQEEEIKQQLAALQEGVYDRPMDEDPRLLSLLQVINQLKTTLGIIQS